jgi:hypothetical protein
LLLVLVVNVVVVQAAIGYGIIQVQQLVFAGGVVVGEGVHHFVAFGEVTVAFQRQDVVFNTFTGTKNFTSIPRKTNGAI